MKQFIISLGLIMTLWGCNGTKTDSAPVPRPSVKQTQPITEFDRFKIRYPRAALKMYSKHPVLAQRLNQLNRNYKKERTLLTSKE